MTEIEAAFYDAYQRLVTCSMAEDKAADFAMLSVADLRPAIAKMMGELTKP